MFILKGVNCPGLCKDRAKAGPPAPYRNSGQRQGWHMLVGVPNSFAAGVAQLFAIFAKAGAREWAVSTQAALVDLPVALTAVYPRWEPSP
jgi:hypothetical protein